MAATDHIYHPAPEEFVELLMKVVLSKGIRSRVIIQSFDPRTLQIIHRKYPDILTSLLIDDSDKRGVAVQCGELGFFPTIYSPGLSLVDEPLVKACHDHGMKVVPWTADDASTISTLRKMGVDGIITDYPDLF
jgi:glycerophosphoryl diester phosphodiesterase